MWYLILIVVSLIMVVIGLVMVNVRGNYETIWGAMLFGGIALFLLLIFGWAGYGFAHLFMSH